MFDFIEANFAILIVFEFFLMTTEFAEFGVFFFKKSLLRALCASAVQSPSSLRLNSNAVVNHEEA